MLFMYDPGLTPTGSRNTQTQNSYRKQNFRVLNDKKFFTGFTHQYPSKHNLNYTFDLYILGLNSPIRFIYAPK